MLAFLLCVLFFPLLFCTFLINIHFKNSNATSGRLPPGPRPIPIIGSLHLMTSLPHRAVARLSKAYGPLLYLRLGSIPTVFVSSPRLVEQLVKVHDVALANRPPTEAAAMLSYAGRDMAFSDYGEQWRRLRRLCINGLLSPAKVASYETIRREEMAEFVAKMQEAAEARDVVDVTAKVRLLTADTVCRIVTGRRWLEESMDGGKFSDHIHEVMRILGLFNLNDAVPWLRPFDLQGLRRRMKTVMGNIDKFLDKIIDEHLRSREEGNREHEDFIHTVLDYMDDKGSGLDRTSAKAIITDMFLGAMDSSAVVIDWAFVELLRHPQAMRKAQEEIERAVGLNRAVEEPDILKLSYLAMVIKETFRLHPAGSFNFRHTKEDIALDGHLIPAGTDVLICVWAMGRDPTVWENAEEFIPERFENSSIDIRGHDYELLPFGSGRRSCPGMNFALASLPLVLAQLVHCFNWELPNNMSPSELDMKEKYGLSLPRAAHLHATPTNRLVRS